MIGEGRFVVRCHTPVVFFLRGGLGIPSFFLERVGVGGG